MGPDTTVIDPSPKIPKSPVYSEMVVDRVRCLVRKTKSIQMSSFEERVPVNARGSRTAFHDQHLFRKRVNKRLINVVLGGDYR